MAEGQAGKQPLVLLLHGFPEFSFSWRDQIQGLAQAGYFVVAPDLRGYGQSDRPIGRSQYRLEELQSDVHEMVRALGYSSCVLVGHDWGAAIAWAAVDDRPELYQRLVILNGPHPGAFVREFFTNPRQLLRSWYMLFFQLPWLPEFLIRRNHYETIRWMFSSMTTQRQRFSPEVLNRFVDNASQPGALSAMIHYYRNILRPSLLLRKWKSPPMPIKVIWGERDAALGVELLDGLKSYFPKAMIQVHRIPGASHWVQQDTPDEVNRVMLEFIQDKPLN